MTANQYSKENIKAARSLALNIALMGGPDITHLSDREVVDRMFKLCGALSSAVSQAGVTADEAATAFTMLGQAVSENRRTLPA